MNFQSEKQLILNFYDAIDNSKIEEIPKVLFNYCSEELLWRGSHPFNEIIGLDNLYLQFWEPFKKSFFNSQRRMDIFLAGYNTIFGKEDVWVVSMGHLMGLFDTPWIGIKHTNKIAMLRYCEFNKIVKGNLIEKIKRNI